MLRNGHKVALLLGALAFILAVAGVILSPRADAVPQYQAQNVCAHLDKEPNDRGVEAAARQLLAQGYDPERVAEIMVSSVVAYCPEHLMVLDRFGQKYA